MAQFQVPQFIDIEQKIIGGKLTMRQFLIVVAGAGVAFLLFFIVDFVPWLILAVFLAAGIFAIAFLKISGRPLNALMRAAFSYYWNPSFYLWRRENNLAVEMPKTTTVIHKRHKEKEIVVEHAAIPEEFAARPKVPAPHLEIKKEAISPQDTTPARTPELQPEEARRRLSLGTQVQSLWEKITTSREAVSKREKHINAFQKRRVEEGFQVMRTATGKMEVAKRIDFK